LLHINSNSSESKFALSNSDIYLMLFFNNIVEVEFKLLEGE